MASKLRPGALSRRPVVLAVGGSDSCGGAGLQADLKTLHQWGALGTSAVTAVTAQNTVGVQRAHLLEPAMVAAQIDSVAADMQVAAVKTGMLGNAAIVRTVADRIRKHDLGPYVLDPVMVATSGDRLLAPDASQAVLEELVPLASLVTPNWPEAVALAGIDDATEAGMEAAARRLVDAGAGAALVKGGHLPADPMADVLWDGQELRVLQHMRQPGRATHGTGCTLAAATVAGLALGMPLADAAEQAVAWVQKTIVRAASPGSGARILDHFAPVESLSMPTPARPRSPPS